MKRKLTLEKLWTARWFITKAIDSLEDGDVNEGLAKTSITEAGRELARASVFASLKPDLEEEPIEADDRPDPGDAGQKLLVCPFADQSIDHVTRGTYRKGYPEGVVVHFTSGHCDTEAQARSTILGGKKQGYAYWAIGPTGQVYQTHPLNRWGHHAGKSVWPGLGSSVSQYLLGIEVVCAGKVDAGGKSWFGKTYPRERLRDGIRKDNCTAGTYVKFTKEQEEALVNLILWLKRNNPSVFQFDYVLGHDSVSPGRKTDPGWSLSKTIPELQKHLKEIYGA